MKFAGKTRLEGKDTNNTVGLDIKDEGTKKKMEVKSQSDRLRYFDHRMKLLKAAEQLRAFVDAKTKEGLDTADVDTKAEVRENG